MNILKCSMCGGDLEVNDTTNIATCGSCGSTMTIAKKDDGQKTNFSRTVVHNNIDVDANDLLGIWRGQTRSDGYRIYLYFKDKSVYWMLSKSDITSISFKDVISYEKSYSLDPYNPDEDVVFGFIRGNNKSFLFKLNKSISGDIDFTVDWETHEDIYTKIE